MEKENENEKDPKDPVEPKATEPKADDKKPEEDLDKLDAEDYVKKLDEQAGTPGETVESLKAELARVKAQRDLAAKRYVAMKRGEHPDTIDPVKPVVEKDSEDPEEDEDAARALYKKMTGSDPH